MGKGGEIKWGVSRGDTGMEHGQMKGECEVETRSGTSHPPLGNVGDNVNQRNVSQGPCS